MPWVDDEKCVGCGICIEKCPVNTITMENSKAIIDMEGCIHCGTCHNVCPSEAVRHDGDKIPEFIKNNVEETKKFMNLCAELIGDQQEKAKCLNRMIKYWNKEKVVAEKTLLELEKLKNK
jgi:ferredoxin